MRTASFKAVKEVIDPGKPLGPREQAAMRTASFKAVKDPHEHIDFACLAGRNADRLFQGGEGL
jgi:hypothetical protein